MGDPGRGGTVGGTVIAEKSEVRIGGDECRTFGEFSAGKI